MLPGAVGPGRAGRAGSSATGHPAVGGRHDGQAKQVPFHVLKGLQSTVPSFPVAYTPIREATPDLFTDEDLVRNLSGPSVREFVGFVLYLNERVLPGCGRADGSMQGPSMQAPSMQAPSTPSRAVAGMVRLLRTVAGYVDEVPPLDRSQAPNIRFGNPAFRTWMSRIRDVQTLKGLMHALLSLDGDDNDDDDDDDDDDDERGGDRARVAAVVRRKEDVAVELASYFVESFGNGTRIDYGTGHETCFVAMLFCRLLWSLLLLWSSSLSLSLLAAHPQAHARDVYPPCLLGMSKLGLFRARDARDIVLVVFKEYLATVRKVQRVYCLEPAGTRGVWGLDDYQILPFLWGSAQLVDHPSIRPSDVNVMDVVRANADDLLYMSCVEFIRDIKQGPFYETSPMLFDISGVESWRKINGGMVKMYCAELLGKRTIMQHFLWGSMLVFLPSTTRE